MARYWRGESTGYVRGPAKARAAAAPVCVKNSSRYRNRQAALEAIGFASYQEYLASELWAAIRTRIMERDHKHCRACNRKAIQVHHITYSEAVLRGDDDTQLVSLCRGCHKAAEFDGETKLTYTSDIAASLGKRVRAKKGQRKALRAKMRPRCRCCQRQYKALGRDDICMGCYKSGRALRFVQEQERNRQALMPAV